MTPLISNARMYAVTPGVEDAWQQLIHHVARDAGVPLTYQSYAAPQPLEVLWRRTDLGCVFMCGYPIALKVADVQPIASPIPDAAWAGGRALYRSDLIVRADSAFRVLEDTFGGTLGWTVEHSHSGFNALRHHLLGLRPADGGDLYRCSVGSLITARGVLDAVIDGRIDVGPLDGYWHRLIQRHRPDLVTQIRVLASTDLAPLPAFVASAAAPASLVTALKHGFAGVAARSWFPPLGKALCLTGFEPADQGRFATTLRWAEEAEAAGYPIPR